jgi:uncharacterized protein (DUF305 family)
MQPNEIRRRFAVAAGVVAMAIHASPSIAQSPSMQGQPTASDRAAMAKAKADSVDRPYTKPDIDFMRGMISHHAQALVMAGWAPSHGAGASVQTLCNRIINAQNDEINIMQTWLRDRGQPVPEAKPVPMKMMMDGMEHEMLMPGMLTDEQLKLLDAARGPEFDKLFLRFMIQHHRGAVSMVEDLLAHDGAAQDELVFKLTNDIHVDQTTEIARMQRMLAQITLGISAP